MKLVSQSVLPVCIAWKYSCLVCHL